MPYLTVWTREWLEPALEAAEAFPLHPGLALYAHEVRELEENVRQRLVALIRSRQAEVLTRSEPGREAISAAQREFWTLLGRMPTVAFGLPSPGLLVEAHLEAVVLEGDTAGVFLLQDGVGVPALHATTRWLPPPPAARRRDPEAVIGLLGPGPAREWVEAHGPGMPPSDLARYEPRRVQKARGHLRAE